MAPEALVIVNSGQSSDEMTERLRLAGIKFREMKVEGETVQDETGVRQVPVIITREGDFTSDGLENYLEIKAEQTRLKIR
ncbi:MAG: hypothetical protein QY322_02610 [bacterium]|nr:MAG: hypothetical protein QY322_02610 [bacterium]